MQYNPNKYIKWEITEAGRNYIDLKYKTYRGYLNERDKLLYEFAQKPLTLEQVNNLGVLGLNECFRSLHENGFIKQQ